VAIADAIVSFEHHKEMQMNQIKRYMMMFVIATVILLLGNWWATPTP
jgi:hypothetical protein